MSLRGISSTNHIVAKGFPLSPLSIVETGNWFLCKQGSRLAPEDQPKECDTCVNQSAGLLLDHGDWPKECDTCYHVGACPAGLT